MMDRKSLLLPLLLALLSISAAAEEFSARYPAGSITTREQADAAVKATQQEEQRLHKLYADRDAACYGQFLVNDCREKVRRERELALRDGKRVEVEAKDTRRRLDQQDLERRRAEEQKQREATAGEREQREKAARSGLEQRQSQSADRAAGAITPEQAARNQAEYERKQKEHAERVAKEQQRAAQSSQNAAEYKQKQVDAAKHAEESAAERKQREEKRAERKKA